MKIIINKAKCNKCKDEIISIDEDEYVYCSCGTIAVSGGNKSIKRLGNHANIIELSVKDYRR